VRRAGSALLLAAVAPLAAAGAQPAADPSAPGGRTPLARRVQMGLRVAPDTVQVGDPFTITARVRLPAGARIVWPALSDSAAVIALRAPRQRRDGASGTGQAGDGATGAAPWRDETATFLVAAWDTGRVVTGWPPAFVIEGADTVPLALADAGVQVQSVLPADTSAHIPRPAKPAFPAPAPWWHRWWPLWAGLVLLGGWLAARRWRRRPRPMSAVVTEVDAHERARRAFARLDRLALADAGEHGRAVTLAVEILRAFLAAVVPRASPAFTSAELLVAVAGEVRVPSDHLRAVLVAADAVKYAGRALDPDVARRLVQAARDLVDEVAARDRERQGLAPTDAAVAGRTAAAAMTSTGAPA
jgi:hypothetical protein